MFVNSRNKKLTKIRSQSSMKKPRVSTIDPYDLLRKNKSMLESKSNSSSNLIFIKKEDMAEEGRSLNLMINKMIKEKDSKDKSVSFNNFLNNSGISVGESNSSNSGMGLKKVNLAKKRGSESYSEFDIEYEENKVYRRDLQRMKNVYDSLSEEENHSEDEISSFAIRKNSVFYQRYAYWITFAVFSSIVIEPMKVIYLRREHEKQQETELLAICLLFDILFLFDLLIHFIVIPKKSKEKKVFNLLLGYLSSHFLLNVLCSIPINFVYLTVKKDNIPFLLEWLFILRIVKLRDLKPFKSLVMTQNLELNRVLKFMILLLAIIHSLSCLFVSLALGEKTFNWIAENQLDATNVAQLYIASIYFHLVTIYTIGFGDILSTNIKERVYNCFLLVCGVLLFSFAVSSISSFFVEEKTTEIQHQFEIFENVCQKSAIPAKMKQKVIGIIKKRGNNSNLDANFEFVKTLPSQLKVHLVMCMYRQKLRKLRFFKRQPPEFILYVLPFIKTVEVEKNELMVGTGEFMEEMYIVVKGGIKIELGKAFYGIEVGRIKANCHFGDVYITYASQCNFDLISCARHSQFYILQKEDFLSILGHFRDEVNNMLASSYQTLEFIESARVILKKVATFTGSEANYRQAFSHYKDAFVMNEYTEQDIDLTKEGMSVIDLKNSEQNERIINEVILKMRDNTRDMLLNNPNIKQGRRKKTANNKTFFNDVGKNEDYLDESPLKMMRQSLEKKELGANSSFGKNSSTFKHIGTFVEKKQFIEDDLIKLIGTKRKTLRQSTIMSRPGIEQVKLSKGLKRNTTQNDSMNMAMKRLKQGVDWSKRRQTKTLVAKKIKHYSEDENSSEISMVRLKSEAAGRKVDLEEITDDLAEEREDRPTKNDLFKASGLSNEDNCKLEEFRKMIGQIKKMA